MEVTQRALARIKALDGKLNAFMTLLETEALAQAAAAERELASRYRSWPPPWRAGGDQGPDRRRRRAHDLRLACRQSAASHRGCRAGAQSAQGRGRAHRQDEPAGICLWRGPSGLWPDQQSLGSTTHLRRLQRRLGRRRGRGPLLRGVGTDTGGIDPHPGRLLRGGGAEAELRPRRSRRRPGALLVPRPCRPAGAAGGRCGAAAGGHDRPPLPGRAPWAERPQDRRHGPSRREPLHPARGQGAFRGGPRCARRGRRRDPIPSPCPISNMPPMRCSPSWSPRPA